MKVIFWSSCLSFALAQAESSSSSLSSSSSVSLNSTSSSSLSSSVDVESINAIGDTTTTSNIASSATSGSASTGASASATISATALSTSGQGNSTASSVAPTSTGSVAYTNPWAGNFSSPVPPTGTGSDYALQCQNAYYSFTSINSDYITATASLFNFTSVIRSVTVTEVHTYYTTSYYTLCDGHPRVITSMPTETSTTILPPSTTVILAQGVSWASLNDPNCTVSYDDCSGLWTRYASASSAYQQVSQNSASTTVSLGSKAELWVVNGVTTTFPQPLPQTISLANENIHRSIPYAAGKSNYIIVTTPPPGGLFLDDGYTMSPGGPPVTIVHPIDFVNTPYTPHCRTERPTCTPNARCQIDGDRVEVFWFPPQTNVTRDMCATAPVGDGLTSRPPTNFTWTPITTGPYTVYEGNTWYSGNVYVSLNRINAKCTWSGTPVEVGETHHGEILTMAPSELFSQRAYPITTGSHSGMFDFSSNAYSFNFNDLISPYPWSAWNGAPDCVINKCTSINGSYNPWLAVPEAIRRLDSKWATCDLALYGLYDPPKALSSVGNIFSTLTSKDPVQQPTPGQSAPQSQVSPTPPANSPPTNNPPTNDPPVNDPPVNNPPTNNPPTNNPPTNNPPVNNPPSNNPPPNNNPPANNPGVTPAPAPTTIGNVGGTPVVINPTRPGGVVIGTQPLNPGGPGTVIGGTSVSMADPSHIIVSAPGAPAPSTIIVPPAGIRPAPTTIGNVGGAPVVINPVNPGTVIVGGSQTLTAGAPPVVVDGTTMSMLDPSHVVITAPGQAPSTMSIPAPNAATPTAGVVITLPNGETVTATDIPGPGVMVSGTLFSAGGAPITLPNGIILSEAPSGTGIVVIDPATGATSTILYSTVSGIGGPTSSGDPNDPLFTGAAVRLRGTFGGEWWISGWILMMMCIGGGAVML